MKVIPFMFDHIMNRDEAVSIFNDVSEDVTFASLPFPTEPMIMQFNVAYAFPSCGHDYSKVHKLNKAWVDDEGVTHKWLFGRSTQYENSRKQESLKGSKHMFRGVTQMPNRNGPIKLQAFFDCCNQSLTRLTLPSILPSIHPSTHPARFFARNMSNWTFTVLICSYFVQIAIYRFILPFYLI